MNPVHSSLVPLFDEAGHFHAIEVPPILLTDSTVSLRSEKSTPLTNRVVE